MEQLTMIGNVGLDIGPQQIWPDKPVRSRGRFLDGFDRKKGNLPFEKVIVLGQPHDGFQHVEARNDLSKRGETLFIGVARRAVIQGRFITHTHEKAVEEIVEVDTGRRDCALHVFQACFPGAFMGHRIVDGVDSLSWPQLDDMNGIGLPGLVVGWTDNSKYGGTIKLSGLDR